MKNEMGALRRIMDIGQLPDCPLEARVLLRNKYSIERTQQTIDYIKNRYSRYENLICAMDFVDQDLFDCMRSDFESIERVWLFPATEAIGELSECMNRLLDSAYKASRDNMRRALELILVGAYFSHSHISAKDANCWLKSTRETPYFSRALKALADLPRYKEINANHNWLNEINQFYWDICNAIHTMGEKFSLRELQPTHITINSIRVPEFNEKVLCGSLNLYIQTVSHMAVIMAAYNPVLLVGLPLCKKFADNPPLSGFFEESQSDALWKLIPPQYHPTFHHIAETDDEVLAVQEWMNGLPDKY